LVIWRLPHQLLSLVLGFCFWITLMSDGTRKLIDMIPHSIYHTLAIHIIYHIILYHTIPYHTIPYHTIPYHTIPYHTIPNNMLRVTYFCYTIRKPSPLTSHLTLTDMYPVGSTVARSNQNVPIFKSSSTNTYHRAWTHYELVSRRSHLYLT
jgi:hypothetical protein